MQGSAGLTTRRCPSCGADLCARPPRSYAEMEGIVEVAGVRQRWASRPAQTPGISRPMRPAPDPARAVRRAGFFFLIAGVCAAAALLVF